MTHRRLVARAGEARRLIAVGAAEPALLGALPGAILGARRAVAEQASHAGGFVLVLAPQRRGLRLDGLAPAFEVDPALLEVLHPRRSVRGLLGLLGLAGRAGEHALRADVHVGQLDPLTR